MAEQRLRCGQRHLVIDHQRVRVGVAQPVRGGRAQQHRPRRLVVRQTGGNRRQHRLELAIQAGGAQRLALVAVNQRQRLVRRRLGRQATQAVGSGMARVLPPLPCTYRQP